jgi:hypothetical protein
MKATFDLPDDLYRLAKARSAMEGRPLRSVAVELFQNWLSSHHALPPPTPQQPSLERPPTRFDNAPWVKIVRPYLRPGMSHDFGEIREAVSRGWGQAAAEKLRTSRK